MNTLLVTPAVSLTAYMWSGELIGGGPQGQPAKRAVIKGKASIVLYVIAVVTAFYLEWLSWAIYVFVALMWVVPDKRIERVLGE